MKTCVNCGKAKPLSDYGKDSYKKDGVRPQCRACRSVRRKVEYANNPGPHRERSRIFRSLNPGYYSEYMKEWYAENKSDVIKRALAWNRANPAIRLALINQRRIGKIKATPKWADVAKIREIYELAAAMRAVTGDEFHVDHIVPLRGRNVCGLHVEFNLQILTGVENRRKGNNHDQ